MRNTSIGVGALIAALAFGAAGCGGDDETSDTSTAASLTKEEFITQGDQICTEGDAELTSSDQPQSQEDVAPFVTDTLIPNLQAQHDDLEALGAPEGDEDEISDLLASLQTAIDAFEADPSSVFDTSNLQAASQAAQDYGFKVCSQN